MTDIKNIMILNWQKNTNLVRENNLHTHYKMVCQRNVVIVLF